MRKGDLHLNTVFDFSYIMVSQRRDDGSQLEPEHVAVHKLIKTPVLCD